MSGHTDHDRLQGGLQLLGSKAEYAGAADRFPEQGGPGSSSGMASELRRLRHPASGNVLLAESSVDGWCPAARSAAAAAPAAQGCCGCGQPGADIVDGVSLLLLVTTLPGGRAGRPSVKLCQVTRSFQGYTGIPSFSGVSRPRIYGC